MFYQDFLVIPISRWIKFDMKCVSDLETIIHKRQT